MHKHSVYTLEHEAKKNPSSAFPTSRGRNQEQKQPLERWLPCRLVQGSTSRCPWRINIFEDNGLCFAFKAATVYRYTTYCAVLLLYRAVPSAVTGTKAMWTTADMPFKSPYCVGGWVGS